MEDESMKPPKRGPVYWFDNLVKKFIPNFNLRAILYFTVIFGIAISLQIWRISSSPTPTKPVPQAEKPKETVLADESYWKSTEYTDKIKHQTLDSFTGELERWLNKQDQEFTKRKFEDILFVNTAFTSDIGTDAAELVPENFNYLENIARARYQYAKDKGFLSDKATLVKIGTLVCNLNDKTEQVTGIDLYDWRYASISKLSAFIGTKPDWKVQIGNRILDVNDPRLIDKDLLKSRTTETQPVGLFSFLIFHDPATNKIVLSDTAMLENNGVDAKLTLSRIDSKWDKHPKLCFTSGYEGCKSLTLSPHIEYGHTD